MFKADSSHVIVAVGFLQLVQVGNQSLGQHSVQHILCHGFRQDDADGGLLRAFHIGSSKDGVYALADGASLHHISAGLIAVTICMLTGLRRQSDVEGGAIITNADAIGIAIGGILQGLMRVAGQGLGGGATKDGNPCGIAQQTGAGVAGAIILPINAADRIARAGCL